MGSITTKFPTEALPTALRNRCCFQPPTARPPSSYEAKCFLPIPPFLTNLPVAQIHFPVARKMRPESTKWISSHQ